VIGTVSSDAKAEAARAYGCEHTINYSHEDVAARVRELTGGVGVNVVFDSVGKDTFDATLNSVKRRGLIVCVGTASGPITAFNPQILAMKGSPYLTRPALADYILGHVAAGRIKIEINQRYALEDAARAHRDVESRKTTGSSVFVI
jgi:NADPH2:quinone reductase